MNHPPSPPSTLNSSRFVTITVYDLSRGLASSMSSQLLGVSIPLVPHTGIVISGVEHFFGGSGVQRLSHQQFIGSYGIRPLEYISLGYLPNQITDSTITSWLATNASRYSGNAYDLMRHNCNNFASAFMSSCLQFEASRFPAYILQIPQQVMRSPMASMFLPMLNQYYEPFSSTSSPPPPPAPQEPISPILATYTTPILSDSTKPYTKSHLFLKTNFSSISSNIAQALIDVTNPDAAKLKLSEVCVEGLNELITYINDNTKNGKAPKAASANLFIIIRLCVLKNALDLKLLVASLTNEEKYGGLLTKSKISKALAYNVLSNSLTNASNSNSNSNSSAIDVIDSAVMCVLDSEGEREVLESAAGFMFNVALCYPSTKSEDDNKDELPPTIMQIMLTSFEKIDLNSNYELFVERRLAAIGAICMQESYGAIARRLVVELGFENVLIGGAGRVGVIGGEVFKVVLGEV